MTECWRMTRTWPSREDRAREWVSTSTHQKFQMKLSVQSREGCQDLDILESARRREADDELEDRAWDRIPGNGGRGSFL